MAFTLRGRQVLLNFPKLDTPKSVIELSPEIQAEIDKELMKKWTSLEVFAVGKDVADIIVGDKVYVTASSLQNAERIEIEGDMKMMIGEYDIRIVW
jgi:hypothetical protein